MITLLLLLSAQAAAAAPDASPPPAPPPPAQQVCHRAPGSDTIVCSRAAQQGAYRLQKPAPKTYGPAAPSAQSLLGKGVKVRGQTSNKGRGGRKRAAATVSVPF